MNLPEIQALPVPHRPRAAFHWRGLRGQRRWLVPRRPEGDDVRYR